MAKFNSVALKRVADNLRELKNWLSVVQESYDISDADAQKMNDLVEQIGKDLELGSL